MPEAERVTWDPAQYLQFADLRLRPALELLARVPLTAPGTVVDLGCGPGNVTAHLATRWPDAHILGVDSSAEMLARAAAEGPDRAAWLEADVGAWTPDAPVDLLYSNATLHWLPDHAALFPRLLDQVAAGGVLAVQMPRNFGEPSHTLIDETTREGPWAERLAPVLRKPPVHLPGFYYDVLAPHLTDAGATLDVWEVVYQQVLDGPEKVAEFTRGTWLKPVLDALDEDDRSPFQADYRRRLADAYPRQADGRVLFPFRRLFIVAQKA